MYQHKNQVKVVAKAAKPTNTLYWYSVAVMLLLFLIAYSPVNAAIQNSGVRLQVKSNQSFQNNIINSIGYITRASATESELAMKYYNDGDFTMAFSLWLPLAKDNIVDAQFYTAMLYDMGKGVDKSSKNAVFWYLRAAVGGNHHAQHNLGVAYADGEGIAQDLTKAVYWWQHSASHGNTDSQYNLGMLYAMGNKSIKRDFTKAHKWWRRAAMSGDAMAQYNLGSLFANGDGVIKNYCEAMRWWQKSAKNGFTQASTALQLIVEKNDFKAC
ncbi:MAG: tetratricopeptide repeat protein [Gammaproteobacteria bacterium]